MKKSRPNVLSIAGFDPSAGAGVLADIKVFEQHQVLGMGVATSLTFQNEAEFQKIRHRPQPPSRHSSRPIWFLG